MSADHIADTDPVLFHVTGNVIVAEDMRRPEDLRARASSQFPTILICRSTFYPDQCQEEREATIDALVEANVILVLSTDIDEKTRDRLREKRIGFVEAYLETCEVLSCIDPKNSPVSMQVNRWSVNVQTGTDADGITVVQATIPDESAYLPAETWLDTRQREMMPLFFARPGRTNRNGIPYTLEEQPAQSGTYSSLEPLETSQAQSA